MRFAELPIAGAFKIALEPMTDERGFFARRFCAETFARQGLKTDFVQHSVSFNLRRGTLRGLHYQADPHAETKLVRCTRGEAFDVLVDLRRSSPTFGRWHAEVLSADNRTTLYIPAGCAHGFQTLADATELDYEISPAYVAEASRGMAYDDPDLAIDWPVAEATLSPADHARPRLSAIAPFP
jgi:dTDP-4-dehydrorhamnose 3,5-epimerase